MAQVQFMAFYKLRFVTDFFSMSALAILREEKNAPASRTTATLDLKIISE